MDSVETMFIHLIFKPSLKYKETATSGAFASLEHPMGLLKRLIAFLNKNKTWVNIQGYSLEDE